MLGLEPLPVLVDQRHQGDRGVKDFRSKVRQLVELVFWVRVQDIKGAQGLQSRGFQRHNANFPYKTQSLVFYHYPD